MSEKLFILVTDTRGNSVRINLQHVSAIKVLLRGVARVTIVAGERIYLPLAELEKLTPYLDALTYTQLPLIPK